MTTKTIPPDSAPIGFWLVPAELHRLELTKIINRLADAYGAPRFMPHVTLLVTKLTKDESPLNILQSAVQGIPPLTLELLGVDHGPDRFKSVFIQLNAEPIEPLHTALRTYCKNPGNYHLDPHLSLLYQQLSVEQRISFISDLYLPQGPLHFDSVLAVKPGYNKISFHDVEQWRLTDQVTLTATRSL